MLDKRPSRIISLIILAIYTLTFGVNSIYAMSDTEHNTALHSKHSKQIKEIGREIKSLKSNNVASSKALTKNIRAAALKFGGSATASSTFVKQLRGAGLIQVNPETLQASSSVPLMPYALHGSANGTPSLNLSVKYAGNTSQRWILPHIDLPPNTKENLLHIYITQFKTPIFKV